MNTSQQRGQTRAAADLLGRFRASASSAPAAALKTLINALRTTGEGVSVWLQVTNDLLRGGDTAAAAEVLRAGLSSCPGDPDLSCLLDNALRIQGRYAQSEHVLRGVLATRSDDIEAARSLAFLLREQGYMQAATQTVLAYWPVARSADDARGAASFLARCGHQSEALEVCRHALARSPDAKLLTQRHAGIGARTVRAGVVGPTTRGPA